MSDFDGTICIVTRGQYMAMLNEFRTINPNLRDRVDDPPVEDDNIEYAPETWNYDVEGEPDYLVMAWPGSPTHKHFTSN